MPSDPKRSAVRIAGLILINAMVFQEELAAHNRNVRTLARIRAGSDKRSGFLQAWDDVLTINYVPIFRVARELVLTLPSSGGLETVLDDLAQRAEAIVAKRGALRHDLMGRVYHRLLHEAKYLGTYYTSVPAATLLLKLTLEPEKWPDVDWSEVDDLAEFRAADLACGTGTLLMATVQAITDNYVRARSSEGQPVDLVALHQVLVESSLWGYDVLASAVHLTASTLALLAPAVSFQHMNLQVLPLGGSDIRLGSVEFLVGRQLQVQQNLFAPVEESKRVTGTGEEVIAAEIPELRLCVMNPPFTRSVGGSLLFGSRPEAERRQMQARLRSLLARPGVSASSTAGLGPVFVAVADKAVQQGGRQALVLPRALASGIAWAETRRLLSTEYTVEHAISSHDPDRWAFSENTELSEILVIAQKVKRVEGARTLWVSLWRNPRTMVEAAALAASIRDSAPAALEGSAIEALRPDGSVWGEVFSTPTAWLTDGPWPFHAFAQTELVRLAWRLADSGELRLPASSSGPTIPLTTLQTLGEIGPDRRDIHDGFTRSVSPSPYPAVWGHDAATSRRVQVAPDSYLLPRSAPAAGRPSRPVGLLWPKAGQLLLPERVWLETRRVASVWVDRPVLSNIWWPFRVRDPDAEEVSKALALWLNSTLGFLLLLLQREETRGAWVAFKKPTLAELPVLDVRALDRSTRRQLATEFDALRAHDLDPFPMIETDSTRRAFDDAVTTANRVARPRRGARDGRPRACGLLEVSRPSSPERARSGFLNCVGWVDRVFGAVMARDDDGNRETSRQSMLPRSPVP